MTASLLQNAAFLQFVVSPIILALIAGIGWMGRNAIQKMQEEQKAQKTQQGEILDALNWVKRVQGGASTSTEMIRESVVNSHKTNLRDDVDRLDNKVDCLAESVEKIVTAVSEHSEHDTTLAKKVESMYSEVVSISASQDVLVRQVSGIQARLDAHIDRSA